MKGDLSKHYVTELNLTLNSRHMNKTSTESASRLLGLVPSLTCWLSQVCAADAGTRLATKGTRRNTCPVAEVERAMGTLSKVPELTKVSNKKLRELYKAFPVEALFRVLFLIVSNTQLPLINGHCYRGLQANVEKMKELTAAENIPASLQTEEHEEFLEKLFTIVQRLPLNNYNALAEICILVRDCSSSHDIMCKLLGPKVLLPEDQHSVDIKRTSVKTFKTKSLNQSSRTTQPPAALMESEVKEASDIFLFLVLFSEVVFCRPKPIAFDVPAVGYRRKIIEHKDKTVLRKEDRIRQLEHFYSMIDPEHQMITARLFEYFSFPQIAKAIWKEYKYLPEGWKGELTFFMIENKQDLKTTVALEWFSKQKEKILELKPGMVESGKIEIGREKQFVRSEDAEDLEMIVEELFCGESVYYERMKLFKNVYVSELLSHALNGTKAEKRKLGLTSQEIYRVFGERLDGVIEASRSFLIELEALRLIREEVTPSQEGEVRTRAGLLAVIFLAHSMHLRTSYRDYTGGQKKCLEIIGQARAKLKSSRKVEKGNAKSFSKLFEEFATNKPIMRGVGVESLLHTPCTRFVQYKLMFERMHKVLGKTHDRKVVSTEIMKLKKAMDLCNKVSSNLNGEIRSREIVERRLGDTGR